MNIKRLLNKLSFSLLLIAIKSHGAGIIEVSVNGDILSNATITDDNKTYQTDDQGRFQFPDSCPKLDHEGQDGTLYTMLEFCGVNETDRVYKFNLTKEITLSGTARVDNLCDCFIRFFNLDSRYDTNIGSGLNTNKSHSFDVKVPAGRYRVVVISSSWPEPKGDYYISSVGVDATGGSVSDIVVPVNHDFPISRFANKPPRADRISVVHTDDPRFSYVTGEPGAAEPLVPVSVFNIQTGQGYTAASEKDGSFSIKFFAPPGSFIQVSQERHADAYSGYTSEAPATVVKVPLSDEEYGIATGQRLNQSQNSNDFNDLAIKGGRDPGVVWLSGELDSSVWSGGRDGKLNGNMQIFSRNIGLGAEPKLESGNAYLELIFDVNGKQKAASPENSSSDMTITGLPIDRSQNIHSEAIYIGDLIFSNYKKINSTSGEATWSLDYKVPDDIPEGIYQLVLTGQGWSMNPMVSGLTSDELFYDDMYGEPFSHLSTIHGAAQIKIGNPATPRLYSALLMNTFSNGSRGTVAKEDAATGFGISGRLITNSEKLILPPSTRPDGSVKKYNIEPFIPLTAYSNKEWISNPKVAFKFPSGSLKATILYPNGQTQTIGPYSIKGSYIQKANNGIGEIIKGNSNGPDQHYALSTHRDEFNVNLSQYGEHVVTLEGRIEDIHGNRYIIDGTYPIYIAEIFDIETGVFPGTPFEVGDNFASSVIIQPGLSADVKIDLTHYPNSSVAKRIQKSFEGTANRFGYFSAEDEPFSFNDPGEYHVNFDVSYTSPDGTLWMASRQWASVVETPDSGIITRGSRGSESQVETKQWYFFEETRETNAHFFTPFQTGDVMWTSNFTEWNAAMTNIVTLEDDGSLSAIASDRNLNSYSGSTMLSSNLPKVWPPRIPPFVNPTQPDIHWGYYYSSIGRPGVSVREFVGTEQSANAYWRFDTPYAYQLGNGYGGDRPNDFKFIFGGAVYQAPEQDFYYYGAYGSLWTMLSDSDEQGGRVMPPFQGAAGGPSGGPLFTLLGEEIDIFLHPQGVRPGSILEIGDIVSFSAQVAPTLSSKVEVSIESPSGKVRQLSGLANKVGYFYLPNEDYVVSEAGVHTVTVSVTHEGQTSAGLVEPPYPTGSVLGAYDNKFEFYVVSENSKSANFTSQIPEKLSNDASLSVSLDSGSNNNVSWAYKTAVMPGFILSQENSSSTDFTYDAYALSESFPNLDLPGGELQRRNGADTITLSFLLEGQDSQGNTVYEGRQTLIQGEDILTPDHLKAVKVEEIVSNIAETESLRTIRTSDGSDTTAKFGAGATDDNGESTSKSFTSGSLITIAGSISPQEGDVGAAAEIFVVLYTEKSLTTLDVDGNYQKWSGSLKTIQPAYETSSLKSNENFKVFSGEVQSGLYRVFLGYRLTDGGPIHFNASAFRISVD